MTCPNCGRPLPRLIAGMTWHARQQARAALARHLEDWPADRCTDRPQTTADKPRRRPSPEAVTA